MEGYRSRRPSRNIANMTPEEHGEFREGFGFRDRDTSNIRNEDGGEFMRTFKERTTEEYPTSGYGQVYAGAEWRPEGEREFDPEVEYLQKTLNEVLPYEIDVDGYYGDETAQAVVEALKLIDMEDYDQGKRFPAIAYYFWENM